MAIRFWRRLFYSITINIFGLSGAIFVTINSFFLFRLSISKQIIQLTGLSLAKIMKNYYQLMAYMELPWVTKLQVSDFPFSVHGAEHMSEVKSLFVVNLILMILSLIGVCFVYQKIKQRGEWWQLIRGIQNTMILTPVLVFFLGINFDYWFVVFHKVFFRNNYWIFDPVKDPIINILPDTFFLTCFASIFIIFECYQFILYMIVKKQVN